MGEVLFEENILPEDARCPPITISPIKKESVLREDGFSHLLGGRIFGEPHGYVSVLDFFGENQCQMSRRLNVDTKRYF